VVQIELYGKLLGTHVDPSNMASVAKALEGQPAAGAVVGG
jgi:hypothetical protein